MKRYIKPSIFVKKAGLKDFVLDLNTVGGSNATTNQWAKERYDAGSDMNLVGTSDNGVTTGGFGTDAGPWESLW